MRATTHKGDEARVKTSAHSRETIAAEEGKGTGMGREKEANREIEPKGLNVKDLTRQSSYREDETVVINQVTDSKRD